MQRQICEHNIDSSSPLSWFGKLVSKQTRNMDPVRENVNTALEAEPCSFPMKAGQWRIMEKKVWFPGCYWLQLWVAILRFSPNLNGNTII